jgi:prophage DNA circulation protein
MMALFEGWRRNLIQASFRGVPFFVSRSDAGVGRRIKIHNAYRLYQITQDMGPEVDEFIIEGYVIQRPGNGFDYFNERDRLIDALKEFGVGELKHPFYGIVDVHVNGRVRIEESFDEGGIARFTINFLRDAGRIVPTFTRNYAAMVDAAVLSASNFSIDNFFQRFETAVSFVNSLARDAISMIQKVQGAVAKVKGALKSTISSAIGALNAIISTVDAIIDSPCDMWNAIKGAADGFKGLVGLAGEVITGGIIGGCSGETRGEVTELDGETIPEALGTETVNKIIEATEITETDFPAIADEQASNRTAIIDSFKATLLMVACQASIRIDFSSQEKSNEIRDSVADTFDDFLIRMGAQQDTAEDIGGVDATDNTDTFTAMENLRNVFVQAMTEKASSLTKTATHKVAPGVEPTLVIAYDLYKDIGRSDDIFKRNIPLIQHPGFPPGGEELAVLEE